MSDEFVPHEPWCADEYDGPCTCGAVDVLTPADFWDYPDGFSRSDLLFGGNW